LLLITGVVLIGLLVVLALGLVLRQPPEASVDG
jgi:hypothetical protein